MKKRGLLFVLVLLLLIQVIMAQDDNSSQADEVAISIKASKQSGTIPFAVQFTAVATGSPQLAYEWDFDNDNKTDSIEQNPLYTYSTAGEFNATATVTDAAGNNASDSLLIKAISGSTIKIVSCFPTELSQGENQVVCIISNEGTNPVYNIAGKIVGIGIQHMTSTSIPVLNQNDQDSITLKINVLQTGNITATLKTAETNFPIVFEIMEKIKYSKDEMEAEFNILKEQFNKQEAIYYEKKAEGYPVTEIFESIKVIQGQIRTIQQQMLSNDLQQAKLSLGLLNSSLADITNDLENVKKPKVTLLMWMKENALAVTAIIAALGTLSGLLIKLLGHARKVKEHAKNIPFKFKKSANTEQNEAKKE